MRSCSPKWQGLPFRPRRFSIPTVPNATTTSACPGNLTFSNLEASDVAAGSNLEQWEKILRMTTRGEMPPASRPQPALAERADFTQWLASSLDQYAAAHPNPGRATIRRLNRAEYANAVRDLLAVDIDVSTELPADDSGYGFDNIADVLSVSPTLMDRYLSVASKISRLATGQGPEKPFVTTYTVPKDGSIKNQGLPSYDERMSDDLPLDSRGGAAFHYYAPSRRHLRNQWLSQREHEQRSRSAEGDSRQSACAAEGRATHRGSHLPQAAHVGRVGSDASQHDPKSWCCRQKLHRRSHWTSL